MNTLSKYIERYSVAEDRLYELVRDVAQGRSTINTLREAIGVVGLSAELLKKDEERKTMHNMMNGIVPEVSNGSQEGICLIGRLGILVERAR